MALPGALAHLDHDAALAQLASGRLLKHIAADYGVSKVAVYKQLCKHPEYKQAIDYQAESLVEQALDEVMNCDAETVNIARARVDAAFKWAAARDPAKWASKVSVDVSVDIGTELQQLCRQLSSNGGTSGGISEPLTIEHESNQDDSDTIR